MTARSPEECDRLFGEYLAIGDLDRLVALYEQDARLVQRDGQVANGRQAIREVLGRLIAMRPKMHMEVVKVVATGALAMVYNDWSMTATGADGTSIQRSGKAIEVMRRQSDGTWRVACDDPYGRS